MRKQIRTVAGKAGSFVKGRPPAQKITAVGAAALLVTAPFGGLDAVQPTAEKAKVGQTFRLGPFDVTVERARTMDEFVSYRRHEPELEGAQLLVLDVRVENVTDVSEGWIELQRAISVKQGARLARNDDGQLPPELRHLADGETLSGLNPDVPVELAVMFEQEQGWDGSEATITFQPMEIVEDGDPLVLDDYYVETDQDAAPAVEVTVPVEHTGAGS